MSPTLCNKCSKRIAGEKIRCPTCLMTFHPGCAKAYLQFRSASDCCINSLSLCMTDNLPKSDPIISAVSQTAIATQSSTSSSETPSTMSVSDATLNLLVSRLTNFIEQQTATNVRQSATLEQIFASLATLPDLKQAVSDHTSRLVQLEHQVNLFQNNAGEVNLPCVQPIPAATSELIIAGIPQTINDVPELIAHKVFNALGVSNLICDILNTRLMRIPSRDRSNISANEPDASATARSNSIVVTLKSHSVRDFIIDKKRTKRNLTVNEVFSINAFGLVYVNELLPPETYKLLRRTKETAAEAGYKHVWVRSGSIFVRRGNGQPVINITSLSDLSKLVQDAPD